MLIAGRNLSTGSSPRTRVYTLVECPCGRDNFAGPTLRLTRCQENSHELDCRSCPGADMESRAKWTTYVRSEAERLGMSWAYGKFGAGFGAFDPQTNQWREPLKDALLGSD